MATQLNESVKRAFEILNLYDASRPHLTAAAVAAELGVGTVTAHRFLHTLAAVGAVVPVAKGVYRLGTLFVDLGEKALHSRALAAQVQPILDALTGELRESSMAAVFEGGMAVCIARAESGRWLSVDVHVGTRIEAYATAHGKLWLAALPEPELTRYISSLNFKWLSPRTITDPGRLRRELARVRTQGYATNDGEREEGIRAVALPVTSPGGRLLVTLSVFGPTARMTDATVARARAALGRAAAAAQAALAGPSLPPAVPPRGRRSAAAPRGGRRSG